MSDPDNPLAWVDYAEEDYTVAQSCLRRKKPLTISACFHAQQCAEKYLKAILTSRKALFPKTHDLRLLNNLCTQAGVLVEVDRDLLDLLSSFAARTRYPGDEPTLEEAHDALEICRVVRRFARRWLGIT